jgi:NAD(P)-dependent dehydrogenase (short-subunit alcohol dehydrogenase family)
MKYLLLCLLSSCSLLFSQQKVVLISGSTGGIGIECVRAFKEKGWKVWAGHRKAIPLEFLNDPQIRLVPLDLSSPQSIIQCAQLIQMEEGRIDALVNNAGYGILGADEIVSMDAVRALFEVNFFGALQLIQELTPMMKTQHSGHILNISSTSGVRAVPGLGLYAASKFALEGLCESLAVTLSPWDIKVSLIEPGTVKNAWSTHCPLHLGETSNSIESKLALNLSKKLASLSQGGQECQEIGQLIATVAEEKHPHMRYQTSEKVQESLREKLVDTTGDQMREKQTLFLNSLISN